MNTTKEFLLERKYYLETLQKNCRKFERSYPEGTLRISRDNNRTQYYHRKSAQDATGTYIPQSNLRLISRLAQKSYNQSVLSNTEKELRAITQCLMHLPDTPVEELHKTLIPERQALITPVIESDEEYVKRWKSLQYQGKKISDDAPELITENGEYVRSKSELIIANMLAKASVPYRYEFPITLSGSRTVYPDFTALNVRLRKEIIWEHLGMMDNADYADTAVRKINAFNLNGIILGDRLILTYETLNNPISTKEVQILINHFLL